LDSLISNIVPGATDELYTILGKPTYYDKTWQGRNTIKVKPHPSSNLRNMRSNRVIFPKSVTTHPITNTEWIEVKIEGFLSGASDI